MQQNLFFLVDDLLIKVFKTTDDGEHQTKLR